MIGAGSFFCFQAEDGIRDVAVTGVQTCALPIFLRPLEQARGNLHLAASVALGFEASFANRELDELLRDAAQVRSGDRLIEANQNIPGRDPVAIADPNLPDNTPAGMLDLLDARIHDQDAGSDDGARDVGCCGPAAHGDEQEQQDGVAHPLMAVYRCMNRRYRHDIHGLPRVPSMPILRGVGWLTGWSPAFASTSSFGPWNLTRPPAKARIVSVPAMALALCATTTTIPPRARTPMMAWVKACSPSESRLEFGSSRTTRKGAP